MQQFYQDRNFLRVTPPPYVSPNPRDSHSDLRKLLLGEVQRVVNGSDSVFIQDSSFGQVGAEDGVVGHIHERHHSMPALIVVPHLQRNFDLNTAGLHRYQLCLVHGLNLAALP